ncbi:MAG TPA: ABC transporter permease [Chryseolinea sp.]
MKEKRILPPTLARKFLQSFLRADLAEEVMGDLEEKFEVTRRTKTLVSAQRNYWSQVFNYLRPFAMRRLAFYHFNHNGMFRSNVKVAVRSLWKNKVLSSINIFGLSVGLSSCLLIGLYIQHEFSYDKFQLNGDRIVRVIMEYAFDGSPEKKKGNFTSTKVAPVLARTFPEVEKSVRMTNRERVVRNGDKMISEPNFMFADSSFFDVFTYHFIEGNPANALHGPNKVVLTRSAAKKYFVNESPLGKILVIGPKNTPYEVTGVMEDYPRNSQIRFDFLASFSSLGVNQELTYWDANYTTFLLLTEASAIAALQEKISSFMKKEMEGSGAFVDFWLESFPRIHLYSDYSGFVPTNSITYLYILSVVATLILVIVCFTYINLSTARSIERAREVGVRKVVGAVKRQLFWQFIGESGVVFMASTILSFGIATVALPYFSVLSERTLTLYDLFSLPFILAAVLISVVVSFLAGCYPALILTGLQPVKVLKGVFGNSKSGTWVRHSLIVFQFAISAFLIASTIIIQKQLHFIRYKKLGYDREHTLVLQTNREMLKEIAVLKQQLKANRRIIGVTNTNSTPVKIEGGYNMRSDMMAESEQIAVTANPIDEEYLTTTGLELLYGEDLTEQDMKDVSTENTSERFYHFILNESAAKQLGWPPDSAVGQRMYVGERAGIVKGVVRDFHFESLHQAIRPLVLFSEVRARLLLVKVSGDDLEGTISFVESTWKQLIPYMPFDYRFLDEDYEEMYRAELQLGVVMNLFAGIAIVLACLGLFGLSAYMVRQRSKEISIRKILGASLINIVSLLSGNFVRLIIMAIALALPIAYFFADNWLQDFAYRIEIGWWVFVVAGASAIGIALLTVSLQSIKAAGMNPVKNLRSE